MINLFRPKTMRRMAVFMALVAPIVYLFGISFFALNGAHGEKILEDTSYVTPSYDELMTPDNFSYGAFDWTNEHGTRYGFSLGYNNLKIGSATNPIYFYGTEYGTRTEGEEFWGTNYGLGFSGNSDEYYIDVVLDENYYIYLDEYYCETENYYMPFYLVSRTSYAYVYAYIVTNNETKLLIAPIGSSNWVLGEPENTPIDDAGEWDIYFDDGTHLPEGVEWNDELRSYFVPTVKPVETTSYPVTLFGSFFPRDNFLVQWGLDAISETPHGFAPFGAFWRYLDTNVLHLSDEQIGLMAYGYMYYAAHVLFFDVGFMLVTFFLSFIQKVGDKIGGEER